MRDLAGRVAVVTGAAGGIGRALADACAVRGMRVVMADVDAEALARASTALQDAGADVLAMVCDVRKASHVEELADAAMIRFHGVHLLFNNAGVAMAGPVWEHSAADWDWIVGANLMGAAHGVRVFTPLMLACAGREPSYAGHIVNTAGTAGLVAQAGLGALGVAANGVVALSEALHHDLRRIDAPVGVSVLCPGAVPTGLAHAERHRPADLRNHVPPTPAQQAARGAFAHALASGTSTAAEVARIAFDAIARGDFYIVPDQAGLDGMAARLDAVASGGPPPDPVHLS